MVEVELGFVGVGCRVGLGGVYCCQDAVGEKRSGCGFEDDDSDYFAVDGLFAGDDDLSADVGVDGGSIGIHVIMMLQ